MASRMLTLDAPIDDYVTDLLALQHAQRAGLPQAGNGKTVPPSNAYAAQVQKDMMAGKSAEYRRMLALWITNLRDGASAPVVKLALRRMDAIIDVEAGAYRPRSIVALSRRETREQCSVDLAQLRIGPANENDVEALELLINELTSYLAVADEMKAEAERRVVFLRSGRTPVDPSSPTATPFGATGRGSLIRLK